MIETGTGAGPKRSMSHEQVLEMELGLGLGWLVLNKKTNQLTETNPPYAGQVGQSEGEENKKSK